MDAFALALLCQAREAVDRAEPATGLEHALLFAVEAAVSLAQVCEAQRCGDRVDDERLREAYSCARAAASAASFAVVEAEDSRRLQRQAVEVRALPHGDG
jgi:hypothetical protein